MAEEDDSGGKRGESSASDVVLLHGRTRDGEGIRVLRARDGSVEAGELRAMKQGVPLASGEIVSLTQRSEHPLLWDVKVQHRVESVEHSGPVRVTSSAYRENWKNVFRSKQSRGGMEEDSTLN